MSPAFIVLYFNVKIIFDPLHVETPSDNGLEGLRLFETRSYYTYAPRL